MSKSESETESFMLKIETQKSTDINPFSDKKDQREINKMKNQSRNPKIKKPNNQYLVVVFIVVILNSVYYSMITKYRLGILLTKVYHSLCLGLVFLIDKFLSFDYENLFIIDEEIDTELKQGLLDSNYSRQNGLENQIVNQISIVINSENNQETDKSKRSKNLLITLMIVIGVISFFVELITFYFIESQHYENLGLVFCLLSYEFIFIKLYNHLTMNHYLSLTNILGLVGIYFFSITLNLIFFNKVIMYFSIAISILRFVKYIIEIKLKNQFSNVVLMISVITDFCLGIIGLFSVLYVEKFHLISFSNFIIIFFASSCYFFYLKNYKNFDITVFSFTFPVLGIIDLIINNRELSILTFSCMLGITGLVILVFLNDSVERNILSYKNNEFTRKVNK